MCSEGLSVLSIHTHKYVIDYQQEMKTAVCIFSRTVVVIGQFKFKRKKVKCIAQLVPHRG